MEPTSGATELPALNTRVVVPEVEFIHSTDDWSGITSAAERRRRQNRLNQRTWREHTPSPHPRHQMEVMRRANPNYVGQRKRQGQGHSSEPPLAIISAGSRCQDTPRQQSTSEANTRELVAGNHGITQEEGYLLLPSQERRMKAQLFALKLRKYYRDGIAQPAYLPTLTRLNVLDAMARNAAAIGLNIKGLCCDDFISPFNQHGPPAPWISQILASCPATLLPTPTQQAIVHHPWIDLIPIPRFRDNILIAMHTGLIDDDELCADLLRFDGSPGDSPALIVWTDSWDIRGWEASVPFLRKWGWLINGCSDLYLATNEWREKRGEKRLTF